MMQELGAVSRFPELCQIYQAIVNKQKFWAFGGQAREVGLFHEKNLRYVDHNGIRYVEQNPNSQSAYADRARRGAKIVWCIRLSDNQYVGRIENGVVYKAPQVAASS